MKINLEKIVKFEQSHTSSPLAVDTLRNMLDVVIRKDTPEAACYKLAFNTLKDMDIIEVSSTKAEAQHLNS